MIDETGARFADYAYDAPDPCHPLALVKEIKDRATGTSLYKVKYYA